MKSAYHGVKFGQGVVGKIIFKVLCALIHKRFETVEVGKLLLHIVENAVAFAIV